MNKKFQLLLTTTLTITEDKITNKEYPPLFEIAFLELSKGRRLLSGKKDLPLSKKDLWILFLTAKNKEVLERMADQNTTFHAAYDRLVNASSDEEFRIQYFNRQKAIRDWNSSINAATRMGEQIGENRFALLTDKLLSDKRFDDLNRATKNPDSRAALYQEYNL